MFRLRDVFPTTSSAGVFFSYMLFCMLQAISIKASQSEGKYSYNTVTAVLLCEVCKLVLASLCYWKEHPIISLYTTVLENKRILFLYLVPSFLYCAYNNLAYVNLSVFDPTTYTILLQIRVVVTGIVFQILFNKVISRKQWFSLILLTSGCVIQQLNWNYVKKWFYMEQYSEQQSDSVIGVSFHLFLILLQTLCSCCAGVYNEYLIKGEGSELNVFVHNVFMYLDSIFWNVLFMLYQGSLFEAFTSESLKTISQPIVIFVIVNNSLIGIMTSLFLKKLNSILKNFASALELFFTAILSWIILGIPIKLNTWVAVSVVSTAIILYAQNPVNNQDFRLRRKPVEDEKLVREEIV